MTEELVGGPLVYVDCGIGGRGKRLLRTFTRSEYNLEGHIASY